MMLSGQAMPLMQCSAHQCFLRLEPALGATHCLVLIQPAMCVLPLLCLHRAFSVIEGTALKVDPNYAIVQECSPYLSRRLLTDNNQRMRAALRQLLYGNGQRLDVARLQRLISSFSSFTTSAHPSSTASGPTFSSAYSEERVKGSRRTASTGRDEGPVLNETMREALKVVFAKDGSYAQEVRRTCKHPQPFCFLLILCWCPRPCHLD